MIIAVIFYREALNQLLMKVHVAEGCLFREIPCPYGCDTRRIYYKDVQNHCDNVCLNRKIRCKKCKLLYHGTEELQHIYDDCEYRVVACPNICGSAIQYNDLNTHMNENCIHRLVLCPLYCQELIMLCSVKDHTGHVCENRSVSCPYQCGRNIMVKVLGDHMENICTYR